MPNLYSMLTTPGEIKFFFKTGMAKSLQLQSHQQPLQESYRIRHKLALHDVHLIYYLENGVAYAMVSARTQSQLERQEYLIKRAILDLKERYNWRVI